MMRRIFLSMFLILTFIFYAIYEKRGGNTVQGQSNSLLLPSNTQTVNTYKDGQYTGDVADAYYGNVQVKAVIKGGKITDVQFLDYPQDRRTSVMINTQAMPYLKTEAIQAQSAQVDIVSGATQTSKAFIESLGTALSKAKI
jgi:uncharacterized protein with FMN-binding domain